MSLVENRGGGNPHSTHTLLAIRASESSKKFSTEMGKGSARCDARSSNSSLRWGALNSRVGGVRDT